MSCKNNLKAAYLECPTPWEETYPSALATHKIEDKFFNSMYKKYSYHQYTKASIEQQDTGVNGCSVI